MVDNTPAEITQHEYYYSYYVWYQRKLASQPGPRLDPMHPSILQSVGWVQGNIHDEVDK